VTDTGGGDIPEAYEVMLRVVRTKLSWAQDSTKVLMVIGDAYPHPPDFPKNVDSIDWKEEAKLLKDMV
jgi:hypothetical protein